MADITTQPIITPQLCGGTLLPPSVAAGARASENLQHVGEPGGDTTSDMARMVLPPGSDTVDVSPLFQTRDL
ncbi:hypothetical protein P7K49_034540 [Saguinus oedipus]|uniref:Uncharacterized protein n=1 Tax=Saguinus oedipus TaxID=9490 RepID=A0ABQ9TV28_SAGOE|nr:hypothetical protein P7K49_034540 [Saguinus oedipus]